MKTMLAVAALAVVGLSACATPNPYYAAGYGGATIDPSLAPTFGTASLSAGFTPDPHTVNIIAGGDVAASVISGCTGAVASAPDYRVSYSAGGYPLTFAAASGADTTLVINGPDGRWSCDDDSGGNRNPRVTFSAPLSGVYDIWIGVYGGSAATGSAILSVSEQ